VREDLSPTDRLPGCRQVVALARGLHPLPPRPASRSHREPLLCLDCYQIRWMHPWAR